MTTTTPIKITATIGAYLRGRDASPADLLDAIDDPGRHPSVIGSVLAYSALDMSTYWTKVGDAEITVTLASKDDQVAAALKALRGQLAEARTDFMRKQAEIMERINKLQALEYVSEA